MKRTVHVHTPTRAQQRALEALGRKMRRQGSFAPIILAFAIGGYDRSPFTVDDLHNHIEEVFDLVPREIVKSGILDSIGYGLMEGHGLYRVRLWGHLYFAAEGKR